MLFVLAIAGFLADAAARLGGSGRRCRPSALGAAPMLARLPAARPRHRARLRARRSPPCSSSRVVRWLHLGAARIARRHARPRRAVVPPRVGIEVLKPYQTARLTGFANPDARPERADVQRHAVDHRRRLGRHRRPRRGRGEPDALRLPPRARDRLRLRVVRRAARLLRDSDPAAPLPARGLAGPAGGDRGRRHVRRRRRGRHGLRASSSRCSSTSA